MELDWDIIKAETNQAKHGVSFSTAARVFLDPHRMMIEMTMMKIVG